MVYRFSRFFEGFQQDLKAFLYWCVVFSIFRFIFIVIYSSQIEGLFTADVLQAMWLGLCISLKTAGILTLIGAIFSTLLNVVFEKWNAEKVRYIWHSIALVFFAICFFVRIPYFQIFNSAFDMMVINGLYDDKYAILMTAINEYQMLWRLPAAIFTGFVLACVLNRIFKLSIIKFADVNHKKIVVVATVLFVPTMWVFVRYGGAFTYSKSINWESAARLKSHMLNEAILDDGQALYRVYSMMRKRSKDINVNITAKELKCKIAVVGGNPKAVTIDDAFKRIVDTPKIKQQPNNVVLIVGESFGLWPFLPQFKELGLIDETTKLQNSKHGVAIETMLAGGSGTISSINNLITGLYHTGIYENYQPNSFKTKYQTGIGYVMKKMGYKTVFWYGGFSGWQNLRNIILAQSFDEFHCADEFIYTGGNAWGCPDIVLFEYMNKYIAQQSNEKVFHMVLTSSNHPPYTINVDDEGFKRNDVIAKLPDAIKNDVKSINELGHMWYMDKAIGNFIQGIEAININSLFVITGDHSERFHFAKEQDIKTKSAIPCIFYGNGISKEMFSNVKVGVHNQIAGTIAELIAPAGFEYSAIMGSMFTDKIVYNHYLYTDGNILEGLNKNIEIQNVGMDMKKISAWRILKGNKIQ